MTHAQDQLRRRYPEAVSGRSFQVSLKTLLNIIRAGNAVERFSRLGHTAVEQGRRLFDVPITFQDGAKETIRCLVTSDLNVVVTVLPNEGKQIQAALGKAARHTRKIHKELKHGPQGDAEAITPDVDVDEEALAKVENVRVGVSLADKLRAAGIHVGERK
jgi:hypothetical protein